MGLLPRWSWMLRAVVGLLLWLRNVVHCAEDSRVGVERVRRLNRHRGGAHCCEVRRERRPQLNIPHQRGGRLLRVGGSGGRGGSTT